ncbi:endothelin-converting enzyme 2 protein [Plakobranchus ocellatus]|uniref:Endothelin-converting enzyme 2 protein n=1 Tax=Plakobranchus ocellatus TaxID=259542 RepID=A0AAV4BTG1_9GAST|nr:endothelin-converting enzyme 2 protein [Plakobranchus ocellatus]
MAFSACIVVLTFIGAASMNHGDMGRGDKKLDAAHGVCFTPDCLHEEIEREHGTLGGLNPCRDFAHYACGQFFERHPPSVYLEWQAIDAVKAVITAPKQKYEKKAKLYFDSCMKTDKADTADLKKFLESTIAKEWPTINKKMPKDSEVKKLIEKHAGSFNLPLFPIAVNPDLMNNTKYRIHIQPHIDMMTHNFYLGNRRGPKLRTYQTNMRDFFTELGAEHSTAARDAEELLDFEIALVELKTNAKLHTESMQAHLSWLGDMPEHFFYPKFNSSDPMKSMTSINHEVSIKDLYTNFSEIGLPQAIKVAFAAAGVTLNENEIVVLNDPHMVYFTQLKQFLMTTPQRVLANYFAFQFARQRIAFTKNRILKTPISKHNNNREEACMYQTLMDFNDVVSKKYVEMFLTDHVVAHLRNMTEKIRENVAALVPSQKMPNESVSIAFKKLRGVVVEIGYPEEGYDDSALNKKVFFQVIEMTVEDAFQDMRALNLE